MNQVEAYDETLRVDTCHEYDINYRYRYKVNPVACRLPFRLVAQPSKSAAYRDKSREWNVSKQKWNLC